jgi:hypothetical protein
MLEPFLFYSLNIININNIEFIYAPFESEVLITRLALFSESKLQPFAGP